MTTPVIEARGLSKSYGSHKALDDVSFRVESGRIVAGSPRIFGQMISVIEPHLTPELRTEPPKPASAPA